MRAQRRTQPTRRCLERRWSRHPRGRSTIPMPFPLTPLTATFLFRLRPSLPALPFLRFARLFAIACVVTGVTLFSLGAFKAKFHDKHYLRSGIETVLLGGSCATVAYFVGQWVSQFTEAQNLFSMPTAAPPLVQALGS